MEKQENLTRGQERKQLIEVDPDVGIKQWGI